jgi:hypothetical protein
MYSLNSSNLDPIPTFGFRGEGMFTKDFWFGSDSFFRLLIRFSTCLCCRYLMLGDMLSYYKVAKYMVDYSQGLKLYYPVLLNLYYFVLLNFIKLCALKGWEVTICWTCCSSETWTSWNGSVYTRCVLQRKFRDNNGRYGWILASVTCSPIVAPVFDKDMGTCLSRAWDIFSCLPFGFFHSQRHKSWTECFSSQRAHC